MVTAAIAARKIVIQYQVHLEKKAIRPSLIDSEPFSGDNLTLFFN